MSAPRRLVLLGHPVAHSLSPTFQQAALDALGIPLRYTALDIAPEGLPVTLLALRAESAAGNITVPHKVAALALCDVVSETAQRVGAVNTFWTDTSGRLCGDNTDVGGFEFAACQVLHEPLRDLRVLVLGAGGAALAVREAVRKAKGASLLASARRLEQARAFAAPLGERAEVVGPGEAELRAAVDRAHLVVNATPLGLHANDAMPLPPDWVRRDQAVLDLTYRREGPTAWVAGCRSLGIPADDGLAMLLEQGALAFERWFGTSAPRHVMRAAVGR